MPDAVTPPVAPQPPAQPQPEVAQPPAPVPVAPVAEKPKPVVIPRGKPRTPLPLFEAKPKPEDAPAAEAPAVAPEAEVKPTEPAAAAEVKPAPAPAAKPKRQPVGADMAKLALEKREAAEAKAAAEKAVKEATEARQKVEAELAELRKRDAAIKADSRSVLDIYGIKFEDLARSVTNGPPMDPRVDQARAQLTEMEKKISEVAAAAKANEDARKAEAQQARVQVAIANEKGKIEAALAGGSYKHAAAIGYDPDYIWGEMEKVYNQTGQLPTVEMALKAAEADAVAAKEALDKLSAPPKPAAAAVTAKPAPAAVATEPKIAPITNKSTGPAPRRQVEVSRHERMKEFVKSFPLFTKSEDT